MKKLMLLAAIAISSGICTAQVSFGVQAGANFAMGKYKIDESYFTFIGATTHSQKNKMKVGFLGGFLAEIPISSSLAFRPELNFFQEGTKYSWTASNGFTSVQIDQKITLNYIQLPLNVVYKLQAGPGTAFFGLGPVVQFGISGKAKASSPTNPTDPDLNKTADVKFDGKKSEDADNDPSNTTYYDNPHLKRFDAGINILAGYKLEMGVFIKIGYSHGFLELDPNKNDPDPIDREYYKNSGFNVSVGYLFGGGGKKKK